MTTIKAEKLLTLARFLDRLDLAQFDFGSVVAEMDPDGAIVADPEGCGTVACAIGWTPAVFPSEVAWYWDPNDEVWDVRCARTHVGHYGDVAAALFGISQENAVRLFTPGGWCPWLGEDGRWLAGREEPNLGSSAYPRDVATSIRAFLRWKGVDVEAVEAEMDLQALPAADPETPRGCRLLARSTTP